MKEVISLPYISDVYPDKAQYLYNEKINIAVEVDNLRKEAVKAEIRMSVSKLEEAVFHNVTVVQLEPESSTSVILDYIPSAAEYNGYGVDIALVIGGNTVHAASTAFDVAASWKEAPRYGFLADFYRQDENDTDDIKQMAKYHLNVVQFYDWMYRHDDLVSTEDYFTDPLGRELSMIAVRNKINACHFYGMKALAYGAVYAASGEFYKAHTSWALYGNNGKVQTLGEWLYIMNTAPGSPWTEHIVGQFRKAVEVLGFDGIHMDTFGFPKSAYSILAGERKLERLEEHFPLLIEKTRRELESVKDDIGLSFNAVGSWPLEVVAPAELDSIYIEVWDPNEKYFQLNQLISRAKRYGKKPVILAAYLSPFSEKRREESVYSQKYNEPYHEEKARNCFLLASAVIFASGGYHFFLGENNGALTNNYYVEYGRINRDFERTVRNYYDFIVRYSNLLFDLELSDISLTHANGINDEYKFTNGEFSSYGEPGKIWTIVQEKPGYKTISLINLTGIKSDLWNDGKENRPEAVENITVTVLIEENVKGVFIASPDRNNGRAEALAYEYVEGMRGSYIRFTVPSLDIWDLIWIKVG